MAAEIETNIHQLPVRYVPEPAFETNGDFLLRAQDELFTYDLTDLINELEENDLTYQGHAYFKELFAPTQLAEQSPTTAQRLASVFVGCTVKKIEPELSEEALSRIKDMYDGNLRGADTLLAEALGVARREERSRDRARFLATVIKHLDDYLR